MATKIKIKQLPHGGWYAVQTDDYTQNTLHCTRKSPRGAAGIARRWWGDIEVVEIASMGPRLFSRGKNYNSHRSTQAILKPPPAQGTKQWDLTKNGGQPIPAEHQIRLLSISPMSYSRGARSSISPEHGQT